MSKLAFIGGTGVYDPGILTDLHSEVIDTPYGKASYESGKFGKRKSFSSPAMVYTIPFRPTRSITGPIFTP